MKAQAAEGLEVCSGLLKYKYICLEQVCHGARVVTSVHEIIGNQSGLPANITQTSPLLKKCFNRTGFRLLAALIAFT